MLVWFAVLRAFFLQVGEIKQFGGDGARLLTKTVLSGLMLLSVNSQRGREGGGTE